MVGKLTFKGNTKKKIETIRREKTEHCKVICICSVTSSLHVLVPLVKILNRLGTVQIFSEDKSTSLLSSNMDSEFELGDVKVIVVDELLMMDEDLKEEFKEYDYNILITQDFLPDEDIDKYIMLNRRHHFREQIDSIEKRYTPILSAHNPRGLSKEEIEKEEETVYVNERLLPLPSFIVAEEYLNSLLMGVGSQEFRVNEKIAVFLTEAMNGVDQCTKAHIKKILQERGEMFVGTD